MKIISNAKSENSKAKPDPPKPYTDVTSNTHIGTRPHPFPEHPALVTGNMLGVYVQMNANSMKHWHLQEYSWYNLKESCTPHVQLLGRESSVRIMLHEPLKGP